jgi:hypothetical protein
MAPIAEAACGLAPGVIAAAFGEAEDPRPAAPADLGGLGRRAGHQPELSRARAARCGVSIHITVDVPPCLSAAVDGVVVVIRALPRRLRPEGAAGPGTGLRVNEDLNVSRVTATHHATIS